MTNIPESIKNILFTFMLKDFKTEADKELNNAILDAANLLDKAFGQWQINK